MSHCDLNSGTMYSILIVLILPEDLNAMYDSDRGLPSVLNVDFLSMYLCSHQLEPHHQMSALSISLTTLAPSAQLSAPLTAFKLDDCETSTSDHD